VCLRLEFIQLRENTYKWYLDNNKNLEENAPVFKNRLMCRTYIQVLLNLALHYNDVSFMAMTEFYV